MSTIHERCRGRWVEILAYAGIDEAILNGRHHPCPGCGGEDRFRYKRDPDGGYFCGDHRANGIDLLMHVRGCDFQEAAKIAEEVVGSEDAPVRREPTYAERVRQRARPLPSSAYLASRALDPIPSGLECIRSLPYYDNGERVGEYPAILAPVMHGSIFRTYHATYVHDGKKAPVDKARKILPGRSIAGAAVQLGGMPQGGKLGVAEGIESAIAAGIMYDDCPVWSVLSANGMRTFDWPASVSHLVIYADNDYNLTGLAAAYHLANRAIMAGLRVEIMCPERTGDDMNDVLCKGEEPYTIHDSGE